MKKVLLSLATVICGFFLFPMPSFAARLDTHSGIVKTNAPNQMAYSTEYLGGALGHYICAGDWYNIVRIYNNSTRYATYPITVPNGIRTITETHYFYGPLFINYADSSTGTFSYYFNPDQWYNYLPSPISYTDQSDSGATDNGSEIYVSNNQGFFVQADSFNNSKLICYDGYTVMRADYVAQPCYYNSSDYYNCNWHWARAQKDWSTSGLIQGINTVYFAGTDASANYTTGQVQFLYDTVAPYAGSVSITNITSSGYDVYVYGVGDATSGVSTVKFPTWTKPDQNDIRWDSGTNLGGGTWFFHVNQSNWGNSVYNYSTHVYVYDNAGNNAYVGGQNEISLVSTNLQINYLPPNSSYRVNTDVVTSFTASNIGNDNILPSGNVSVSFSVYYLNGSSPVYLVNECKSGVVIPANNSNLIYFKWHVPDIAGKVIYVSATINSFKTIPETNMDDNTSSFQTVIEAPSNSQTPDTQYESRAPAGYAKTVASAVNGSVTWTEWTYTNGSFSRINYGVQLNVNSSVSPDSSVLSKKYLNGYWHIRSGYGFSVNVSPNISTVSGCSTPPADAYTSAQRAKAMLPEYRYNANALGKYCDLQFIDDTFQFVINSNAQNKRIHFIPLWIPDGDYIVQVNIYDLWTPAGMISGVYPMTPLKISGSAYDDCYPTVR